MGALTEDVHFIQRIEVPAQAENIALAEKLIDEVCAKYNVPESLYGNILISYDRVRENARSFGVPARQELHRVMVHGLLHLMGHSDKSAAKRAAMRVEEDKYLALLR